MSEIIIKVGSKGDIYLKKDIQKKSGIRPNDTLILEVEKGKLIFKKKAGISELAQITPIVFRLSDEENQQIDKEINDSVEL